MGKATEVIDGAEASVETGIGHVTKIEPKGRNARVEVNAEHLKDPVAGWVDTHDVALSNAVADALAEGYRIGYRIVVRRKDGVDPTIAFDQLDKGQKVRDFAGLERVRGTTPAGLPTGGDQPPATQPTVAPPANRGPGRAEDAPTAPAATQGPVPGGADATCPNCGGTNFGGPPVRRVRGTLQHVECPAGGGAGPDHGTLEDREVGPDPADAGATPPRARTTDGKRGARIEEAKPWEPYNSDGSLNLGSYAVNASDGFTLLAHDLLLARAATLARSEGRPPAAPTEDKLRRLTRRLLRAADRCQATARADGRADRMDTSHSRARGCVRSALDAHPVPWDAATAADLDAWEVDLATYAAVLFRVAISLVDVETVDPLELPPTPATIPVAMS